MTKTWKMTKKVYHHFPQLSGELVRASWQIAIKVGQSVDVSGVFCWQIATKVGQSVGVSGVFCLQIAIKVVQGAGDSQ